MITLNDIDLDPDVTLDEYYYKGIHFQKINKADRWYILKDNGVITWSQDKDFLETLVDYFDNLGQPIPVNTDLIYDDYEFREFRLQRLGNNRVWYVILQDTIILWDWSRVALEVTINYYWILFLYGFTVTPNPVNFGQEKNKKKESRTVVVKNTGIGSMEFSRSDFSGLHKDQFKWKNPVKETFTLEPNEEQDIKIEWKAQNPIGIKTAAFEIRAERPDLPDIIVILGGETIN